MADNPKTHGLHKNVAKAAAIREMCNTKGFKVLQDELEKEIKRVAEKVLDVKTDEQEALKLRRQAQVSVALQSLLKKILITGEFSARTLEQLDNLEAPSIQEGQA